MQRLRTVTSLDVSAVAGHHAMPAALLFPYGSAGPHSTCGSVADPGTRGPGFDTRLGHLLSFLLPLIQDEQLSFTGESMCTYYISTG